MKVETYTEETWRTCISHHIDYVNYSATSVKSSAVFRVPGLMHQVAMG